METVFSTSGWKDVHDINFITSHGRGFSADFTKSDQSGFDVTILISDDISEHGGSWIFETIASNQDAETAFETSILFIQRYLAEKDSQDSISEVINPCNDPFVKLATQDLVLTKLGLNVKAKK